MALPFTADQFFEVFGLYNRALWPIAIALWLYALAAAVVLARARPASGRFVARTLAVQWAWAAVAYHAAFFAPINPAAWIFAVAFLAQSALFATATVAGRELRFSRRLGLRLVLAWILIAYALLYPLVAIAEGHALPNAPTFGVPCPTTLLTIGCLLAVEPPWPRALAVIPVLWAFIGGSAALLLGVRADLMLWIAGGALTAYSVFGSWSPAANVRHQGGSVL